MRRIVDLLIGICALMLSVMASVGCTTDPDNPVNDPLAPSVEIDNSSLTRISVLLKGQMSENASEENEACGFDMAEGGFASGKVVTYNADTLLNNHFSANASLSPGKYYYVKSWYSSGKKKKYSQEIVFMAPLFSVATLSDITCSDGIIRATILDSGGSDINEVGFCWSTVNDILSIKRGERGHGTLDGNDFYMNLSDLMPGKTYYFMAYAENSPDPTYDVYGYNRNPFELALSFDNYVDIEDDGFESYLLANYDSDHNGWLSIEELALVDKIDVSTDSIYSISEINLMPGLNTLIAKGSDKGKGKLTTVDVTNNTGLRTLICDNNNLESLLIQQVDGVNSSLEVLSINNTGLASFDVSPFVALRQFACSENHVESLDLTPLKILDSLVCSHNDIRKLDISGNPLLRYLDVTSNPLDTIFLSATQKVPSLLKPETTVLYYLIDGITVTPDTLRIFVGETKQVFASVIPAEAVDKTVNWSSNDEGIASVSSDGEVTGIDVGSCTVTATSWGHTAQCYVIVMPIAVESVSLDCDTKDMVPGERYVLHATVLPENATDKTVTWDTNDSGVATVSSSGEVTAVGPGSCIISATSGTKTATCQVTVTVPVSSITLDQTTKELNVGDSFTLQATVLPDNATDKTVIWTTSDPKVAEVSSSGIVTAIGPGACTITATCGGKSVSCSVSVVVPVSSVTLDQVTKALNVGETFTLKATVLPDNSTEKVVVWNSSNNSVASVTLFGVVTALKAGSCTITASCGGKTASCEVTVTVPVSSIELDQTSKTINVGESFELKATILPNNATDKTVNWTTSDSKVAEVSSSGMVTAIGAGSCTIEASAGDKSAACIVTVVVPVSSIVLDHTSKQLTIGESFTLQATVLPDNATDKTIVWSSSDSNVASVSEDGLVSALAVGTCTVTALCGGNSSSCTISVKDNIVPVASITLDNTTKELTPGDSFTLKANVLPENATYSAIEWTSSDESVATVTSSGLVTAVDAGTCVITASCEGKSATCTVTVSVPVTSITLDETSKDLNVGESFTLTAFVQPDNATDKTIVWTTSDESVAVVSASGVITAVGPGICYIFALCGDVFAYCTVTVLIPVESVSLDYKEKEVNVWEKFILNATVLPDNSTEKEVVWNTSNSSIASVSLSGEVTALKAGICSISATCGGKSDTCIVTVVVPVSSVTLDFTSKELNLGDSFTLEATVSPEDATNKTITWASGDEKVATVSTVGEVRAVGAGTCSITASSGGKTASCDVTVIIPVNSITLDQTSKDLNVGESFTLQATILPDNATDKTVTWSSDNESVATVSDEGVVTGISLGTCNITATAGEHSASSVVTVAGVPLISDYFPDQFFRYFIKNEKFDTNNDGILSMNELSSVKFISLMWKSQNMYGPNVTSLKGIEYFFALEELFCRNNDLKNLDLSNNNSLSKLTCTGCQLESLLISPNAPLKELDCSANFLRSLDVSNYQYLKYLYCTDNQLISLELPNNLALVRLECHNNQLTSLDVSNHQYLERINCGYNQLVSLDISGCSSLISLVCWENQLTILDVSSNLALESLWCSNNPSLTEIWLKEGQTIATFDYNSKVATIYYK